MNKRKLVAGNWKMNGRREWVDSLVRGVRQALTEQPYDVDVAFCPPFPYLFDVGAALSGTALKLGAQDCSERTDGAFTGDISATMLRDMACDYVIIGHSERREFHGETNQLIASKMVAAHKAGLTVIVCVGEKDAKMDATTRNAIVKEQIRQSLCDSADAQNTIIAYEPVWAIGSGLTPTNDDIVTMHGLIAGFLPLSVKGARILYGGSVKADNAATILQLPGVDGALVGGASLKKDDFIKIIAGAG
ncbi:MAG: triose-phosphate isomerase [Alphaproteobacteria bacterium]|nr:triose-phosphate isomerase [Alphaproteobacteria bacterium]